MIRWTGLATWEFEFPFPGSRTSTFLVPDVEVAVPTGDRLDRSETRKKAIQVPLEARKMRILKPVLS